MTKLRSVLIVLGVVGFLAVVGLTIGSAWLNSFIHSDAFRHEVETRASRTLGGTVEIKQIDLSIWSGVTLNGLATKLVTDQGAVVAQVESVRCSYSLLALISRKLQLDGVTVVTPDIVLTQEPPASVTTPKPTSSTPSTGADSGDTQSGKTAPMQVTLNSARITDGHIAIKDATGAVKADLQGVQVHADTRGYFSGKDVTGSLKVATIALPQNLKLTDFSTPFTYRAGVVEAKPFEATAFGGNLTGDYTLDPSVPSLLTVNATHLDMAQVGATANPGSSTKLSGSVALQSTWHNVETGKLTGEGNFQLTDGKLEGVTILNELATAFQVSEMRDPILKSATAHFYVANGTTRFNDLVIKSEAFDMAGHGVINPQGGLDADMVLILHEDALGKVPGVVISFFTRIAGGGASIPFHLSGTSASPESDLMTRGFISGSKIHKTISKTFDQLFH